MSVAAETPAGEVSALRHDPPTNSVPDSPDGPRRHFRDALRERLEAWRWAWRVMRRRRRFHRLACVSACVFITFVALWVQSGQCDAYLWSYHHWNQGDVRVGQRNSIISSGGRIIMTLMTRRQRPATLEVDDYWLKSRGVMWGTEHAGTQWSAVEQVYFLFARQYGPSGSGAWQLGGLSVGAALRLDHQHERVNYHVAVPDWMPMAVALPAPLLWLRGGRRLARLTRRRRLNICRGCGYDLRGSVGARHCPECGVRVRAARPGISGQPGADPTAGSIISNQ